MLNHFEEAGRLIVRACIALFTVVVLLVGQSVFWDTAVSGWMRVIVVGVALVAYFRPNYGLIAIAVLVPLGQIGSHTLDSTTMRGAEALAIAFLAGALVRGWILHRFNAVPADRLQVAGFAFALVVAASCIEQVWFAQLLRDFPVTFYDNLLHYASRRYYLPASGVGMIASAMLLLEGIALMTYSVHHARSTPGFSRQLVVALVGGAVAAAAINLAFIAHAVANDASGRSLGQLLVAQRWTVHVADVNAAASFFGMMALVAGGIAWLPGKHRVWWLLAAIVTAAAFWMTGSRTGLIGAAIVITAMTIWLVFRQSLRVLVVTGALAAIAMAAYQYFPAAFVGTNAGAAMRLRWLFLEVASRMVASEPIFGIGIGQYPLRMSRFASPELLAIYPRENAHNYFAQVAGELGGLGLLVFVAMLVLALFARSDGSKAIRVSFSGPVLVGLAFFLFTWLGGHPLLVPEVTYPFWLLLGIVAGLSPAPALSGRASLAVAAFAVALAASLPARVEHKTASVDFTRVEYGLTKRTMVGRARFFVRPDGPDLTIPLRAGDASAEAPVTIEVMVDGSLSKTVTLSSSGWQKADIVLPALSTDRPVHQIDLRIPDVRRRAAVEVGEWSIISKPDA